MTLEPRARQLPDESVVMRYPTRAYQTDQPSACRPFCYQHIVRTRIFYKPLDRSNTYQCSVLLLTDLCLRRILVSTQREIPTCQWDGGLDGNPADRSGRSYSRGRRRCRPARKAFAGTRAGRQLNGPADRARLFLLSLQCWLCSIRTSSYASTFLRAESISANRAVNAGIGS